MLNSNKPGGIPRGEGILPSMEALGTINWLGIKETSLDILCLDLEGVLIPEIWQAVAERPGLGDLNKTTRDIPDYGELMQLPHGRAGPGGPALLNRFVTVIDGLEPAGLAPVPFSIGRGRAGR